MTTAEYVLRQTKGKVGMSGRRRGPHTALCLILFKGDLPFCCRPRLIETSIGRGPEILVVAHTTRVGTRKENALEGRRSRGSGKVTRTNYHSQKKPQHS